VPDPKLCEYLIRAIIFNDPLEHFVKRDMVLIHSDKQVLLDAMEPIRCFLRERLQLILQPATYGFSFLGA